MARLAKLSLFAAVALVRFLSGTAAIAASPPPEAGAANGWVAGSALATGSLGLFPVGDFRLAKGECPDCTTIRQALWYFGDDLVAVPKPGVIISGSARGVAPQEDVRRWYAGATRENLVSRPPLVWLGSPEVVAGARLQPGGTLRLEDGRAQAFRVTPKIAANRSYYDAKTAAFFEKRPLRLRGHLEQPQGAEPTFVARTIWPQDYTIDATTIKLDPLAPGETMDALVKLEPKAERETFDTRLLWERTPGKPRMWDNHAVLAILLNGAQGDDDEAHGGHFAIVTGRYGPGGPMADWIVNNFYNLDYFSEKGIVASMVPMDNYQMDLNSGQSYYRPSYMLVALLKDDHAAHAYQGAIQRVYNRFYRHDFLYDHAASNCAGISIDTLRALGWNVPERGPTSYVKAVAAYPYMAVKEMSLESGRKSFAYLKEEQTRLYPAVAFDAIGTDLLHLVGAQPGGKRNSSAFEKRLQDEVEAVIFVRIPQVPSSRAFGTYPVASIDEYLKRVPEDKSNWQIVPVDPRPFPREFTDAEALQERIDFMSLGVAGTILAMVMLLASRLRRRKRAIPGG